MRCLLILFLLLTANFSYADDNFPAKCQALVVQGETVQLETEGPALVMIHNLSTSDLWITHPVSEPSASAGWSSRLSAGNWSALTLDEKKFELSCIESRPGHEQQIPCEGMISVCKWQKVKLPEQSKGTYWAGEDQSLSALLDYLGGRGFKLPES